MPFRTEHSCRLIPPGQFQKDSFRRKAVTSGGKPLTLLIAKKKGKDTTEVQAYRYPVGSWSATQARTHCKSHSGILFEPASLKKGIDEMEFKEFEAPFELKALDEAQGIFEGHAAIFGQPDQFGDVIVAGAFKKSLHKYPKKKVKMLRQHKQDSIIGVWLAIKEDDVGLFVKGQLLLGIQAAQETLLLLKAGALDSLSIGFRTVVDQFDTTKKVRSLLEIALFEISLVAVPAQMGALVTSVKHVSPEDVTTKRDLECALRDAGFSVSTSKFITAGWNPPARRDVEGGTHKLVESVRALTSSLKPV